METEGIKFFIKFNLTDQYADSLINSGEIYTNCARYYIYQKEYENKEGVGDDKEGLLFEFIRTNTHLPLYCMYEVNDANLIYYNGKCYVKINKLMIDHFANGKNTNNTSFVVINSKGFIKATKKFQNIYNLRLDKIRYANLSICKQKDLINDKTAQRLILNIDAFFCNIWLFISIRLIKHYSDHHKTYKNINNSTQTIARKCSLIFLIKNLVSERNNTRHYL